MTIQVDQNKQPVTCEYRWAEQTPDGTAVLVVCGAQMLYPYQECAVGHIQGTDLVTPIPDATKRHLKSAPKENNKEDK